MFTFFGTFERQKKSKKKEFVRHEFTFDEFYVNLELEDTESAAQTKGFILVDKLRQTTSVYLDVNGNGKLNKSKDLLIGSDVFEKALYKKKKGTIHGTNNEDTIELAEMEVYGEIYGEVGDDRMENGFVFNNKNGRPIDIIRMETLHPCICMMDPRIADDEFRENCNTSYGMELV